MLILSADPYALTPEVILKLALMACSGCGTRGPHQLVGVTNGGASALCGRCAEPERSGPE